MVTDDPLIAYEDDPVEDAVHQPYTAFNQGWDAAEEQIPSSLNPYEEGSREHDWWESGYQEFLEQNGAGDVPAH